MRTVCAMPRYDARDGGLTERVLPSNRSLRDAASRISRLYGHRNFGINLLAAAVGGIRAVSIPTPPASTIQKYPKVALAHFRVARRYVSNLLACSVPGPDLCHLIGSQLDAAALSCGHVTAIVLNGSGIEVLWPYAGRIVAVMQRPQSTEISQLLQENPSVGSPDLVADTEDPITSAVYRGRPDPTRPKRLVHDGAILVDLGPESRHRIYTTAHAPKLTRVTRENWTKS